MRNEPGGHGGGRHSMMEMWKCGLRHSRSSHKVDYFSLCGKLVGHLPVCNWLCVVKKRRVNVVNSGWDNQTSSALLTQMIAESVERATHEDPTQGEWYINGEEVNVCVDSSLLVLGVLLEKDRTMVEDVFCLQSANDARHINLTELDAMVKGINLALQWQAKRLHLSTDSLCKMHQPSNGQGRNLTSHQKLGDVPVN